MNQARDAGVTALVQSIVFIEATAVYHSGNVLGSHALSYEGDPA